MLDEMLDWFASGLEYYILFSFKRMKVICSYTLLILSSVPIEKLLQDDFVISSLTGIYTPISQKVHIEHDDTCLNKESKKTGRFVYI